MLFLYASQLDVRSLLNANTLIALLDDNHVHCVDAVVWLDDHVADGWASCPIAQNGRVRILSPPCIRCLRR